VIPNGERERKRMEDERRGKKRRRRREKHATESIGIIQRREIKARGAAAPSPPRCNEFKFFIDNEAIRSTGCLLLSPAAFERALGLSHPEGCLRIGEWRLFSPPTMRAARPIAEKSAVI